MPYPKVESIDLAMSLLSIRERQTSKNLYHNAMKTGPVHPSN